MPIVIPKAIPAFDILNKEHIFVMPSERSVSQDIRPLEIAIVNLMPDKISTETQLLRLLSNTPLQVNLTFLRTESYRSTTVSGEYLERFYKTFSEVEKRRFDGLIVTGAPVETLAYNEVKYWDELCRIMDFAEDHVTSTIYICWGAQAALKHFYGVEKYEYPKKLFGIFKNRPLVQNEPLLKGMNDKFSIPHSRMSGIDEAAVYRDNRLEVLAAGDDCGISIVKSKDNRKFFFLGHSEYDRETLKNEYLRDLSKGAEIAPPENYFIGGDHDSINFSWNSTANLLFYNWLNYYVYQVTPYDLERGK